MRRPRLTKSLVLAACYLLGALAWVGTRTAPNPPPLGESVLLPEQLSPGSASAQALQDSAFWWTQSVQVANDAYDAECAALAAWDPAAVSDQAAELRRLMASDPDGYLLRARRAAMRAAALAQTRRERHLAARQLGRLESAAEGREAGLRLWRRVGSPNAGSGHGPRKRGPPVRLLD